MGISSYGGGDMGGAHGVHGMRPISDAAHEATESAAQEKEEHRTGKEAKHMMRGGKHGMRPKSDAAHERGESAAEEKREHVSGEESAHEYMGGAHGAGGGKPRIQRRTKATPGRFYSDGMMGLCHNYDGMDGALMYPKHEFAGGGAGAGHKPFFVKKGK